MSNNPMGIARVQYLEPPILVAHAESFGNHMREQFATVADMKWRRKMNDVMTKIHDLSTALDKETASLLPASGKLLLLGSQDSVFLKAVHRKADALGIECDYTFHFIPPYQGVIVDGETVPASFQLSADVDIDNFYSPGMSAVSQAVLTLLLALDLVHAKDITIVGRGHAVQNLAKHLTLGNATVTVAHSKTKSLLQVTMNRDVVIYATPTITKDISYNTRDLVIDLGNSVPHPDRFNCPYVNRIGQLTVSVLLNRFARKEHRA